MDSKDQFKLFFENCCKNYYSTLQLKNDLIFYMSASEELKITVFNKYNLIPRIQNMTVKLFTIQLKSVLKQGEGHSFFDLIKKHKKISKNQQSVYNKVKENLDHLLMDDFYNKISDLRNKHYAHLASDMHNFPVSISIQEIESFTCKLELVFKEIYLIITNHEVSLAELSTDIDMFLFTALSHYDEIDKLIYRNRQEGKSFIQISEVQGIRGF